MADEHAVSRVMLGPRRSKTYDSRFDAIESVPPVIVWEAIVSGTYDCRVR